MKRYPGSCHCGAVTFQVELDDHIVAQECNCSMCNNLRCLQKTPPRVELEPFDGQHWEQHAAELAHLSKD